MNNKIKKLTLLLITIIIGILLGNTVNAWYVDPNAIYGYPYDSTPYSWGQCTWFVWGRAKQKLDISLPGWGDAGTWADSARNAGYTVDYNPTPDSIAVWPCSYYYVGKYWYGYGHVAYVEEVSGNQMAITEGNWAGQDYSEKWISTTDARGYASAPQFIHLTNQTEEPEPEPIIFTPENLGTNFKAAIVFNYLEQSVEEGYKVDTAIAGTGDYSGANVALSKYNSEFEKNEIWEFERQDDGSYFIKNTQNDLYLDVIDGGTANYTNIQLCRFIGGSPQKWYFCKSVNGGYRMIPKSSYEANVRTCLDIVDGISSEGTNVHLWEYDDVNDATRPQTVYLHKIIDFTPENLGTNFEAAIVFNYENSATITGMGNYSGANVAISNYDTKFSDDQIWKFERQSDESYNIKNKKYNLYLDVADGKTDNLTNIQLCKFIGGSPQRWYFCKSTNGGYRMIPKSSYEKGIQTSLDVNDGLTAAGTNVQLWEYDNVKDATKPQTIYVERLYQLGDINEDGQVNSRDAKLALQYYVGKTKLTENQKLAGDVNKDGEINSRDAKLILQYYVGK